jgi:hypothetical protein
VRDELEDVAVRPDALVRGDFSLRAGDRLSVLAQHALQRERLSALGADEKDGREATCGRGQ